MPDVASAPSLALKLLQRAEQLGRGQTFHAAQLNGPRELVLEAMAELLRGGFALGTLRKSPSQVIEDATFFGITAKGKELRQQLSESVVDELR